MPGLVLRSVTRAIAKAVVQEQLEQKGGLLGGLVGIAGSVVTEQADDRIWRMLPGRVYIARGYLPVGEHQVVIDGRPVGAPVRIDGQYSVVPLRVYDEQVIVGEISKFGQLPQVVAVPTSPVAAPAPTRPVAAKPTARTANKPVAAAPKPVRAAKPTPAPTAAATAAVK